MQKRILVKKQSGSPKILNFRKEGGLYYMGGTYIFFFIQNGANFAQPLLWIPKTPP
jgi:hypothetical protein